jgi:hypothetical protein
MENCVCKLYAVYLVESKYLNGQKIDDCLMKVEEGKFPSTNKGPRVLFEEKTFMINHSFIRLEEKL